jgi:predicted amidophosphoribosyltransferase
VKRYEWRFTVKHDEWGRYPRKKTKGGDKPIDEVLKELKKSQPPHSDCRERSLKIHGLICARCGREFDYKNRHLLTVHHKDGNHLNNPPDGSNWENLCVYCHDDEHSRELLGKYLTQEDDDQSKKNTRGEGGSKC